MRRFSSPTHLLHAAASPGIGTGLLATVLLVAGLSVACSRSQASTGENAPAESAKPASVPAGLVPAVAPGSLSAQPRNAPFAPGAPALANSLLGSATNADGSIRVVRGQELASHLRSTGYKGTVVNVWASWCGPCRRELPMLVGLSSSLAAQGIEMLFVSVDEPESEQTALNFMREQGGQAPIYVAERPLADFKQELTPRWRGMLPATFLFDASGTLRYLWGGPVYDTELLPVVDGFLAGKEIDGESNFGLAPGKDARH